MKKQKEAGSGRVITQENVSLLWASRQINQGHYVGGYEQYKMPTCRIEKDGGDFLRVKQYTVVRRKGNLGMGYKHNIQCKSWSQDGKYAFGERYQITEYQSHQELDAAIQRLQREYDKYGVSASY